MADQIKVDTARVASSANKIASCNEKIKSDFSSVESAVKALNNVWDGNAASNVMTKFQEIKSQYHDSRYNVVKNFVNFLHQQVDAGYTQTETVNKSLADLFK